MIHHPPVRGAVPQHKRLFGIGHFQTRRPAGTAPSWCCTAIRMCRRCTGSTARRARCRWSASPPPARRRAAGSPAAQYNLLDIDGEPAPGALRLTRRGLTGPATPPSEIWSSDLMALEPFHAGRDAGHRSHEPKALSEADRRVATSRSQSSATDDDEPDQRAGDDQPKARQESRPALRRLTCSGRLLPSTEDFQRAGGSGSRRRRPACAGVRRCARRRSASPGRQPASSRSIRRARRGRSAYPSGSGRCGGRGPW